MIRPAPDDEGGSVGDEDGVVVDEHLPAGELAAVVRDLVFPVHVEDVGEGVVEDQVVPGCVVLTWNIWLALHNNFLDLFRLFLCNFPLSPLPATVCRL